MRSWSDQFFAQGCLPSILALLPRSPQFHTPGPKSCFRSFGEHRRLCAGRVPSHFCSCARLTRQMLVPSRPSTGDFCWINKCWNHSNFQIQIPTLEFLEPLEASEGLECPLHWDSGLKQGKQPVWPSGSVVSTCRDLWPVVAAVFTSFLTCIAGKSA